MAIVSMLSSERGVTAKIRVEDLIDTSLVAAASRIEVRLLSETRSVFEYLQKTSLYLRSCVVNKWQ